VLSDASLNLAWPSPPTPPRVRFLRELDGPEDIVPAKGKVGQFFDLLTGDEQLSVEFMTPYALAFDGSSVFYVTDSSAGIIHRYDFKHREVTYITKAGDMPLASPVGIALDKAGNVYVSDSIYAVVFKFDPHGTFLGKLEPPGGFSRPAGIAINSLGEKYVVDVTANKLLVFDTNDRFVREFPDRRGGDELNRPSNVAVDRDLNVYVTDSMNFTIKIYDHSGTFKRRLGQIGDSAGSFARPKGVAVDSDNHIYVVDAASDNFQIFDQEGRLLLVVGKNGKGPGEFYLPSGICIDGSDRLAVADTYNRRIQFFEYVREGAAR
jgi:DNA-binding beta-propeller fold protein YncE